jgi:hypothetical protein
VLAVIATRRRYQRAAGLLVDALEREGFRPLEHALS